MSNNNMERRATDRMSKEALMNMDQVARKLRVVGLVVAAYVVVLVTVASVIGVVNSFQAADQAHHAFVQAQENRDLVQLIKSCVTPGPNRPTATEGTGHKCYDRTEAARAKAVNQVRDSDRDGKIDLLQIIERLDRLEKQHVMGR